MKMLAVRRNKQGRRGFPGGSYSMKLSSQSKKEQEERVSLNPTEDVVIVASVIVTEEHVHLRAAAAFRGETEPWPHGGGRPG